MGRGIESTMTEEQILQQAQETIGIECKALAAVAARLDDKFVQAVSLLLDTQGRVVVTGVGKSGAVARKLAGTLASTGTPAFFMHPTDAIHGDMGMVGSADIVIIVSNSGETDEVLQLVPLIKRRGGNIIAMCGNVSSTLSNEADIALDASVEREACPLGLAPTASTTAAMALGDALAMATMSARGFTVEDYAVSHPGGALGRRVLMRVSDIMHGGGDNPTVALTATVLETLLTMTQAPLRGVVSIVDEHGGLQGLFTDGDFRRLMQEIEDRNAVMAQPVSEVMTTNPTSCRPDMLAVEAARIMQQHQFDNLPVVDEQGRAVGIIDIQDLVKAGLL